MVGVGAGEDEWEGDRMGLVGLGGGGGGMALIAWE